MAQKQNDRQEQLQLCIRRTLKLDIASNYACFFLLFFKGPIGETGERGPPGLMGYPVSLCSS